ncbi:hypothetical protein KX928_12375 [Roseobacter sp. YSTF-M11]|uniref:Uncharacterized protein n=1 Tax=Roseobacter insulae TaxID=2859783 RepID=A0A9X1FWZ7_9RHOB|nr:hypothetical protein [Roseobacter insulae]MBW4708580.1 hypothetical protein [Roseobacter insulae]
MCVALITLATGEGVTQALVNYWSFGTVSVLALIVIHMGGSKLMSLCMNFGAKTH